MSLLVDHKESAFEALIVAEMAGAGGWEEGDRGDYDARLALCPGDAVAFVRDTQSKTWDRIVALSGGDEGAARASFLARLAQELDRHGSVHVLRRGIKERGVPVRFCQFRPAHGLDAQTEADYAANRLTVVRQVPFDPAGGDELDLVLFVNGIPTATAELKNRFTGQTVENAITQYRQTRPPHLPLFASRAFVHFALDSQDAAMTTRLAGPATSFLPFNEGSGGAGNPGGKGNPPDPEGHPTSYLWRRVWERDRWLELIQKFVHVEPPPDGSPPGTPGTVVFPRFHQWDVVLACTAHAKVRGAGHSYLIQHSAGSGKTKEIAWLAHELSTLHDDEDRKVFDKVVVITDRRVLDQQLQRQVAQFEQVRGVVASVEKDSAQLRAALAGEQARIVVSTLQKFPFVLEALRAEEGGENAARLKARQYALIVDEAHSSQTGEAAVDLKAVLGDRTIDDLDLDADQLDGVPTALLAQLAARGRQGNLSFFAFTATPKARTLELFGEREPGSLPRAFHVYSMRQAIEEEFILDVLRGYATYDQLYRLETKAHEQIEVPKGKAAARVAAFAAFHPYAKAQKARVVIAHYLRSVRPMLGGEAKAMVVTASRHEAVRWKQALDREIEAGGHADVKVLVAFSGEVTIDDPEAPDHGERYTEPGMNAADGAPLPEARLPEEFDKAQYGVLVVAEKYQTGFDQPRLCAMYVDKRLSGVNAVQTLSRLNRKHPSKDRTYVVDFVNDADEIRGAFEPYFEAAQAPPTDPNALFDAADTVRAHGIVTDEDLSAFQGAFARAGELREEQRHALLSTTTEAAYRAAVALEDDARAVFREDLQRFVRHYAFLAQVVPYIAPDDETLYLFSRILLARLLSAEPGGTSLSLSGMLEMTHYRLEGGEIEDLGLTGDAGELRPAITGEGRGPAPGRQLVLDTLGDVVAAFNARYGTELTDEDMVEFFRPVQRRLREDEQVQAQARANDFDDFLRGKSATVLSTAADVNGVANRVVRGLIEDEAALARVTAALMRELYDEARSGPGEP
ncbi:MAG: type I restriction endonuclease [Solirubrobacteraceae bacterium]